MKKLHKDRLLKLAEFLEKLPRKKFNFGTVVSGYDIPNKNLDCGSVGCAIGWCPIVFPKLAAYEQFAKDIPSGIEVVLRADPSINTYAQVGMGLFDISRQDARALFGPGMSGETERDDLGLPNLEDDATPKAVAKNIRRFVALKSKA